MGEIEPRGPLVVEIRGGPLFSSFVLASSRAIVRGYFTTPTSGPLPLRGATSTVASGDRAQAVVCAKHWVREG